MIVYNITVNIDTESADEWLNWMTEKHIPEVMATGHFKECKLCRVIGEESGGKTYAITYTAKSKKDFDIYQQKHAPNLQQEHTEKFKGKFVAFRTLMPVIQSF